MKVEFAPAATADLSAIAGYIALDNPARAESFTDELVDRCLDIPDFPESGVARSDLEPGIRVLVHGRYLILYRMLPGEVRIERIVHGSRTLPDLP
ncbi:MAG: type II toxin-antitoxin system RelE/ParE family toxin [Pseudomonadota bacterium]|nr:type II toxin-antitoxin system RelE/ParE family toxin [Pseudomonadota bacterium]